MAWSMNKVVYVGIGLYVLAPSTSCQVYALVFHIV